MQYLATVDASFDGSGNYVVQARYQYPAFDGGMSQPQGWTNVDYFDATQPDAYNKALTRANTLCESKHVAAVRVIQVKEWYRVNMTFEPVKAPDTQPATKP